MKAKDADKAKEIMADMDALRAEIYSDPNVAIAERVLRQRFLEELSENRASAGERSQRSIDAAYAPQSINIVPRVFLPNITGGWNLPAIDPEEPCAPYNTLDGVAKFSVLLRGDLLFRSIPNSYVNYYYAIKFSHVGMYDGDVSGQQRVYASNIEEPGIPGGVHLLPISVWQAGDSCISLMYENISTKTQDDVEDALDWAQARYGTNGETRYNFNFSLKENDQCAPDLTGCALYCSQLIWQIFNDTHVDVNVDSNNAAYHDWLVG